MQRAPQSSFVQEFQSREARDRWSDILDLSSEGGVAVVHRRGDADAVVVGRSEFDALLSRSAPFDVEVSFTEGQVSMWVKNLPVHGVGPSLGAAEEELLDALLDYADSWVEVLKHAPNHSAKGGYVQRILMTAGDRRRLHDIVFGDDESQLAGSDDPQFASLLA
jgi:hypothetical protein